MTTAVTFPRNHDLSGLRLEQSLTGNVISPWFTFDFNADEKANGAYNWTSRYHLIVGQSKEAFARLLHIQTRTIMVSERKEGGELWWRLSTAGRCELPVQPKPKRPVKLENRDAIEI